MLFRSGTCEGYEDTFMDYTLRHIARNNYFELPRLLMKKKMQQDDIWREDSLGGVVITGTKVKLAYRGDTLVYNASAFNLPEGSMLDGLIRQMPGAELKDNGDIYINGKKVDYLTLNGKDFFKGQNKVMLDNLPYYTVKELKVYDKSTKQSQLIGHDVEKKDYVMDVQLKREYNRGYMANAEAGAGSNDRYMARLFGLYYDDHTRLSLFGNTNNVNESRRPGDDGEWSPSNMPQGLRATKQTGLHLSTEDADKNWEETLDATLEWSDADNWSRTDGETFATDGNIFRASESFNRQKDFHFKASNHFEIKKPLTLMSGLDISYTNGRRTNSSQDSTWRGNTIVNSTRNDALNRYRTLSLSGEVAAYKKFDWGDYVMLNISANYNRQKPSEAWQQNRTYYAQNDSSELRHYYEDTHGESYNYKVEGSYVFQLLNRWYIHPFVEYQQEMQNANNLNHRLDRLYAATSPMSSPATVGGSLPPAAVPALDMLPSTREALLSALDEDNCDEQLLFTRTYRGGLEVSHSDDKQYFSVRLPVEHNRERLRFNDFFFIDTLARRSHTHFTPSVSLYRWGIKRGLQHVSYRVDVSEPEFADLMPAGDTKNPLALHINNPDLRSRITHNMSLGFVLNNDSLRRFFRVWTNASMTSRAWGTQTIYEQGEGTYIYIPDNIDGNWYWGMGASYQQPLDKKKRLTLTQRADVEYNHNVDFDILYVDAFLDDLTDDFPTSTVNNWTLHEHLGLEYQKDKLTATLSGDVNWRSATGDRQNFERISAFDFNYGATLRYTIPWVRLSLATDLKMFSRRGYSSSMMNTDDLVWNAELSRSLLKERLTLKLTAFDLLHELSNKQYSVNAQGRTERWNNCIPRYVMFTAAYKLTQQPKKK